MHGKKECKWRSELTNTGERQKADVNTIQRGDVKDGKRGNDLKT
jgi:hypothetical protein